MRILLLGKNGQVGWELQRSLAPLGELIALDANSEHYCGDLTNQAGLTATLRNLAPDIIVNAAAYTAVDKAESEPELARFINAEAVALLAEETTRLGAWLVHYSTDYVFDGHGDVPWRESDATAPLNCYGATKAEGERAIQSSGCHHLLFRTSWVYAARGNNFAKTMLRLAQERDSLNVISDQFGAPTGAELLADVTAQTLRMAQQSPALGGLYHLAAGGETNWWQYAQFVLEQGQAHGLPLKVAPSDIGAITAAEYPTPARRPQNSRLNTEKLRSAFALDLPNWRSGVARMLTEALEKN
jgi:dTDP-4-dehydrorhamnose reductase